MSSGGGGGSSGGRSGTPDANGPSWRDPNSGTIYYNIDKADSSYQTDRVNGGRIPSDAVYNPDVAYKAPTTAKLMPNAPSVADLYSGNFDHNYLTGNSLALDPRFTNAQKSMITANNTAYRNNGQSIYDSGAIDGAGQGGYAGWNYSPGKSGPYSYVQEQQAGGQHFISPTYVTAPSGDTYQFKGLANDPKFGAYVTGTAQKPQDMEYSWERTEGPGGTFSFNQAGADNAASRLYKALVPLPPANLASSQSLTPPAAARTDYALGTPAANTSLTPPVGATNTAGLTPNAKSFLDLLPPKPVYTAPTPDVFDPVAKGMPGEAQGWTWTKGLKAREQFDQEQALKADEEYRKYQTETADWTNQFNLLKYEQERQAAREADKLKLQNDYLAAQGLTPVTSLNDITPQLREYGRLYNEAIARGDRIGAEQYHQAAENLRQKAWGVSGGADGSLTAGLMTSAGQPTWERQYKDMAYQDAVSQQEFENSRSLMKGNGGSSGGGRGGSGGSGSSGGGDYVGDSGYYLDTQGERANVMTGGLLERAIKQYELNTKGGGNAAQHPLYYALNSLFNDSKWRTAATSSGANIKKVADALITKYSGKTPKDYFSAGRAKGSNIEAAYKQLLSQAERESWDY